MGFTRVACLFITVVVLLVRIVLTLQYYFGEKFVIVMFLIYLCRVTQVDGPFYFPSFCLPFFDIEDGTTPPIFLQI